MYSRDEFFLLIEDLSLLPAISPSCRSAFDKMEDPEASLIGIGHLIEEDPGLASRLIKVANSPFYPYSGKVGSVREALVRLGLETTRGVILTTSLFDRIRGEAGVYALWQHSLAVSMISRNIAGHLRMPYPDEVALAGLLHDIGKIPYFMHDASEMHRSISDVDPGRPDYKREKEAFGMDHMEIGEHLTISWRFPSIVCAPIRWHHNPAKSPEADRTVVRIVALGDLIASAYGLGHPEFPFVDGDILQLTEELNLLGAEVTSLLTDFLYDRDLIVQRSHDVF